MEKATPGRILQDLSLASSSTRKGGREKGRFVRTPNYSAPISRSTRPSSDQGVTFHFAHKTISKRNDISQSSGSATSASAHQGYIERKEAGAEVSEDVRDIFSDYTQEITEKEDYGVDENYFDSDTLKKSKEQEFKHPELVWSKDRLGFGTVGNTPAERRNFWNRVEHTERRHGRVQSRIIAELPHEVTTEERAKISLQFCETLREKGLPFWAAVHAPTDKNDKRNHHLHIAYYDRPSTKTEKGTWDFEVEKTVVMSNRTKRVSRPLLQNKAAVVRDRGWVKTLRKTFSEASNKVLEMGKYVKRLDPRSYKESGISKDPTRHLGFKANAMESFGLDTKVGQENSKKEFSWKILERTRRWTKAIAQEEVMGLFSMDSLDDSFFKKSDDRIKKLEEGKTKAIRSVKAQSLSDQMIMRFDKRKKFLGKEGKRLLMNGRGVLIESTSQDVQVLGAESEVLTTRENDVLKMSKNLANIAQKEELEENKLWKELALSSAGKTPKAIDIFSNSFEDDDMFMSLSSQNKPAYISQEDVKKISPDYVFNDEILEDDIFKTMDEKEKKKKDTQEFEEEKNKKLTEELLPKEKTDTPTVQDNKQEANKTEPQLNVKKSPEWAFMVAKPETSKDIKDLDNKLKNMTNKKVRVLAVGTRDLVDFLEDGEQRESANRGWVVLRNEAIRRGVDLETGKHNITKATDKERAELHKDEYLESVLEVRQEVIRIQGR
jgi:hypothetical protein